MTISSFGRRVRMLFSSDPLRQMREAIERSPVIGSPTGQGAAGRASRSSAWSLVLDSRKTRRLDEHGRLLVKQKSQYRSCARRNSEGFWRIASFKVVEADSVLSAAR